MHENKEFKQPIPDIGRYEQKRMNRYLVSFPQAYNIPQWVIFEASRPSVNVINRKIFGFELFKTFKWDDLIVKMRDPIGPSTSQAIMDLVHKNHKTKKRRIKEKFTLIIEMIDPVGHVIERWQLDNCEIKSVDFGSLTYESDNAVTCTLTIKLNDVLLLF
jgi:hypothetical protein